MRLTHTRLIKNPRLRGFSLIEVSLALLVVGVGLLALLQLFPFGMRESQLAVDDSGQSTFAQAVFSTIRANAAKLNDWDDWNGRTPTGGTLNPKRLPKDEADTSVTWTGFFGSGGNLVFNEPGTVPNNAGFFGVKHYFIRVKRAGGGTILRVTLWTIPEDLSELDSDKLRLVILERGSSFYTEFFYQGNN